MKERLEPNIGKWFKVHKSIIPRFVGQTLSEVPFAMRLMLAPRGDIIRNGVVDAEGRVVKYAKGCFVLLTDDGTIVFPNWDQHDSLRIKSKSGSPVYITDESWYLHADSQRSLGVKQQ